MTIAFRHALVVLIFTAALTACAGGPQIGTAEITTGSTYSMSPEELGLDCNKLTGRMQVRIMQIRGYEQRYRSSGISRGLQSITTPWFGGTKRGMDPDGQYAQDKAQLEAYNSRLAAKGCPTYNLERDLATTDPNVVPRPGP